MAITFVSATAIGASATQPTINVTSGSNVAIDDVYVAVILNHSGIANAVSAGVSNPTTNDSKIIEGLTPDTVAGDYDHQYTVFVGVVTTGGAQTYTFTKATDDNQCFAMAIAFYRGVDTTTPVDVTAPAATETTTYADDVSFPAFDPTSTDVEVCFAAFYPENATTFAAAMSADTNPDCTIRFDVETNLGDDACVALTSGANDGSSVAARTWASAATIDASNTGVVFALRAASAGGGSQTLAVDAGSYSITGIAATLKRAAEVNPDSGSYSVTGSEASLEKGYKITAEAGTYTITGVAAGLTRTALITPDSGVYTLSGTDAGLAKGRTIAADPGSYAITGQDATLKADRKITPDSGSYSITGTEAGLNKGQRLSVDAGSYAIQGSDATLTVTRKITPDSGIYSISGIAASLLNARKIIVDSGTYTITGITANLTSTRKITIVSGVYSISGSSALLEVSRFISIAPGSYVITGQDATLTLTAAQNKTLVAAPGSYSITGQDVQFVAPRRGGGRARKQDLAYLKEQWETVYGEDEEFIFLTD